MTPMRITKAAGAIGAFVECDLDRVLDSVDAMAGFRAAVVGHGVVFVRDQPVDGRRLTRLGRRLGAIEPHPTYGTLDGAPDVQILESTPDDPSKIELWHSDMTFRAVPPTFTMLQADVVPSGCGDTMWASTTAAFESLSDDLAAWVEPLSATHDFAFGFQESLADQRSRATIEAAIAANPPVRHPVVRPVPESGGRAIFVNPLFTRRVDDLTWSESRWLLETLHRHVIADEHTVRLQWRPGTIAVWDNRSTQHKPVNDFFGEHRRMLRLTINDD